MDSKRGLVVAAAVGTGAIFLGPSVLNAMAAAGVGSEWKGMPWQVWRSPVEVWKTMPTFVLAEWGYRTSAIIGLLHAIKTGRKKSWCAAVVCGTANDIFFMFMPFCDNFWQAQASVMITPRLPLYIVEMYACVMYYAPVAASLFSRSMGMNPIGQACLTGLLAHLYYGVYDVNGPRYLWWTWHDGDPSISQRQANAPLGSSLWILTYCSLQAFLNSWILRAKGARLTGSVAPSAFSMSAVSALASVPTSWANSSIGQKIFPMFGAVASRIDMLQQLLGRSGDTVQILFRAAVATPVFMVMMGQLSFFSLDKLGVPGQRTYVFTLVLMIGVVVQQMIAGSKRGSAPPLPAAYKGANRLFVLAALGHFALHTCINYYGTPEIAVSTGIHQQVTTDAKITTAYDIMNWPREEELRPNGPHTFSKHDYVFQPVAGVAKPASAIEALPEGPQSLWYSVYGTKHHDRAFEWAMGSRLAAMGSVAFCLAMRRDL